MLKGRAEALGHVLESYVFVEMKAAARVGAGDFRHVDRFRSEGPGRAYRTVGFVVYLGDQMLSFGGGKVALPLSMLWSFPPAG